MRWAAREAKACCKAAASSLAWHVYEVVLPGHVVEGYMIEGEHMIGRDGHNHTPYGHEVSPSPRCGQSGLRPSTLIILYPFTDIRSAGGEGNCAARGRDHPRHGAGPRLRATARAAVHRGAGAGGLCRKVAFSRPNPKIGSQKINGLRD
jgi:hypothetical protein